MSRPVVTAADRLAFTLVLALLVHGLLVFGLRFVPPTLPAPPVMEVTWVPLQQASAPVRADFIAVTDASGTATDPLRAAPPPVPVAPPAEAGPSAAAAVVSTTATSVATPEQAIQAREAATDTLPPLERVLTMDATSARTDAWAGWLQQFRTQVEAAGNAGFPDIIRDQGLTGDVRLRVSIDADGQLLGITVLRSSGQALLDRAAMQSVRDAQPFPPFPADVRQHTDRLQLVRTWRFASTPAEDL